MSYRNNPAGLLPSFDPQCASEHGIASIDVQHLSRNETGAREIALRSFLPMQHPWV